MTTTPMTSLSQAGESRPLISTRGWFWIAVLGVLFVAVHHVFLRRMGLIALHNNNWSHALLVPLISVYYIFQKRDALKATPMRLCWWGLPLMLAGLVGYAMGIYPIRNDMAQGYSMILSLFGLVLFLLGPGAMRLLWFPIVFLGFAVKVSDRVWDQIAAVLQQAAAVGATFMLKLSTLVFDFSVSYQGSRIDLSFVNDAGIWVTEPLNVAEACAGLRMLMAFLALGTAMAFLWNRTWWQRLVMVAMAAPIAVFINMCRVAVLGLLYLVDPRLVTSWKLGMMAAKNFRATVDAWAATICKWAAILDQMRSATLTPNARYTTGNHSTRSWPVPSTNHTSPKRARIML